MKQLLADHIFSPSLRYEGHKLVYTPQEGEPIVLGGILGAAVLGALLYGQDEGRERAMMLNAHDGRKEFFTRYEDETLHENGGLFTTEVQALCEAYMELNGDMNLLLTICGNDRLYDLAFGLMVEYMETLAKEQIGEHIYDLVPWSEPFAQWLYNAGFAETRRQQLLAIRWDDPDVVYALAEELSHNPSPVTYNPLFVFDGLSAEQLLNAYWQWLWDTVEQDSNLYPDAKARLAEYKKQILKHETNYDFLKPEIAKLQPAEINLFTSWMNQWSDFVNRKIKPEKTITFWTKNVTEEQQEALLDYLKTQERQPQRYKCLAVAVYSLRQLGYITYNIAPSSIAKWLSERLQNDYSSKTSIYQFRRAWNELRRFHPAVQDEVAHLAECGVKSIK